MVKKKKKVTINLFANEEVYNNYVNIIIYNYINVILEGLEKCANVSYKPMVNPQVN